MNVSFDDTDPYISFSPEWRIQPPNSADTSVTASWQGTYHASQSYGATANVTFSGAGIYIYGSKGPGNANYSVEIDDRVFYLPGYAPTQQFQQLLYGQPLRQGSYTLVLTNESKDPAWLDLDFIMVTTQLADGVSTQTNPGSFATTKAVAAGSQTLPPPPAATSLNDGAESSTTKPSQTPKILAIVFGALLALFVVGIILYFVLRKVAAKRRAEQEFRYGSATPGNATLVTRSVGGAVTPASGLYTQPNGHVQSMHTSPFDDAIRSHNSSPGPPSVVQIGRSVAMLDAEHDALTFPRAQSSMSGATSFSGSSYGQPLRQQPQRESVLSTAVSAQEPMKGKEWRPQQGGASGRTTRQFGGGAQSIKTFVQVMDE
ncbi:hypothetical protein EXIGLDRAFT_845505 [Exidia glandulosa HHB12029]|uniref:Uncharacterized protein n=1 Tax=Exidia glandulosa HHB12029 TaxID=1314781 RepID=A0A165BEG0_EXIGL|nr:hypothetical protein EXIGLDRAFT_845505 [Exidia glandulosa HHB12029]